jgi:arylsulfatase
MDRLAGQGVSFSNSFVSAVPCSPSRACLLTGSYTTQNGIYQNVDWLFWQQPSLNPTIPTLGHLFQKAGYATPYRGKWHLTRESKREQALRPYGFEGWVEEDPVSGKDCNCGENAGGPARCGEEEDPLLTRQVCDWLSDPSHHQRPWFMTCSLVNPHDICQYPRSYPETSDWPLRSDKPPPNWKDDLSTKPGVQAGWRRFYNYVGGKMDENDPGAWRRYLDYYIHCIEDVDGNVGKVIDALERSGQKENTIVVFTSDHGDMGGSHQLRAKGPFAYDEIMNVPLVFSWPGHLPQGVTTEALVSNVDIMPTLASLTGIRDLPYQAGKDFSQVLHNPATASVREEVLYHVNAQSEPPGWWARTIGRWVLGGSPGHVHGVRTTDWKYVHYYIPGETRSECELYLLKDDPLEMRNLAGDEGYAKKQKELHDHLMELEQRYAAVRLTA